MVPGPIRPPATMVASFPAEPRTVMPREADSPPQPEEVITTVAEASVVDPEVTEDSPPEAFDLSTTEDPRAVVALITWQEFEEAGVSGSLGVGLSECESGHNPDAIGAAGERGHLQLHPQGLLPLFYAEGYTDPEDPRQAARFSARYMAENGGSAWINCLP